jgi:hypothetical protein
LPSAFPLQTRGIFFSIAGPPWARRKSKERAKERLVPAGERKVLMKEVDGRSRGRDLEDALE